MKEKKDNSLDNTRRQNFVLTTQLGLMYVALSFVEMTEVAY